MTLSIDKRTLKTLNDKQAGNVAGGRPRPTVDEPVKTQTAKR